MKPLWKVTLSPPGEVLPVDIQADRCEMGDDEALYFYDHPSNIVNPKAMFAPGQWVMVERIYEDGESESAANYNAYKELEKDD